MLVRQPVAAGRFYPLGKEALKKEVHHYIETNSDTKGNAGRSWAYMLPHAGYIFCGDVIGKTLAEQKLPSRLIILCPNHTGRGAPLGVWPNGVWLTPIAPVQVDEQLAEELIQSGGGFQADTMSHLAEHSIEVLLPFLQEQTENLTIVPVCIGTQNPQILAHAAKGLANVLKMPQNSDVGIIISSDMNHYENEKNTIAKDEIALERACANDPDGLLKVVRQHNISMCGAGPMALALYTAKDLGNAEVNIMAHETSAKASGDYNHTVGYAGLRVNLKEN